MKASQNPIFRFQLMITLIGIGLFALKITAWYFTQSVAVLTDALESTVNISSALLGLYSIYLSAKPKDEDHPYGHGKIEFLTSAIEGALVFVAGLLIILEAIKNLRNPHEPKELGLGIIIIAFTGLINFIMGWFAVKNGRKSNSLALVSGGKHLQSDTYSTMGIVLGLILMQITGLYWLDSIIALIFAFIILFTGYKIIRESIAGIMDEADEALIEKLVNYLEENRAPEIIDLHNLRMIKYGRMIHLDCHITVPWYFDVTQAHSQIDKLDQMVAAHFGNSVELFVHVDACIESSCKLCTIADCPVRKHDFVQKVKWTHANIRSNKKHEIGN